MADEFVEGGCLCGAVRYRFSGVPKALSLCHCVSCRRAAGAPAVAWTVVPRAAFSFVSGAPSRFRSSPPVERTFCAACGTPLTYRSDASPATIDITTASLDRPELFAPTKEIWLDHRIPWMATNPALERYAASSIGAAPLQR
ncbi:MAG TPA: GFA family protein [Rhizomicrobium sp.]|nr:GFA family protein [Rhizomicrobium sp.]